ncbi:hypothetical protein [Bizionia arctica]|uniref:PsbP C-terminal domain-containing protein n=1 Tax=Bizionia arctica TaxID=1495645 RepID=A0A917LQ90_9FLAO|nr:hypothetical protein [Bizionia arctica]GGG50943.1 hypothetical protein GCM10010976_22650 [Bizionia arctica]
MKIKLLLISLIIFQFASCQSNKKSNIKEINKNGYIISYPSNLKSDESGKHGSEFLLFTEKTDSTDNFSENINLIIQNLETLNLDLNKFVEITENQIKANGNLISSERIKNNTSEFQKIIYSVPLNNFDLKFIQYDFVVNNKAYILTFTAKENEFDTYSFEMEKIMKTFKIE